jgi:hypothetical protein
LGCRLLHDARLTTQIKFENTGNHDDGLGPMSVLEHRELERFRTIHEQAAATVLLVLDNPVTAAVLADKEKLRSRRGRFQLAHDTSPSFERRRLLASSAIASMVEVRHPDRNLQCDDPGGDDSQQRDRRGELANLLEQFHVLTTLPVRIMQSVP